MEPEVRRMTAKHHAAAKVELTSDCCSCQAISLPCILQLAHLLLTKPGITAAHRTATLSARYTYPSDM
jgi:hypothetical protein